MVFESLVVDLLNRFLGPYVENLDASQLKLGIWSGDAVLQELFVKEGALDQLDLPVKIKTGHLGKLTLKIPWKNLYSAPVEATLEGLHILVVPNADIKYDAEKDEKQKFEAKQRTLQGVEDAKKKEAEKNQPKDPKSASFAEKLATQVIKNIQVRVSDIHVRYEDRTTNPEAPFAIGASLEGFSVLTTDENWLPCILDQSVEMVYKLLRLDSLAVYWNCDSVLYSKMEREQLMAGMKESVATQKNIPKGFQYLIEPISSQAQLRINPRPDANMDIPKAWLNLVINTIGVALQRKQFRDVMQLLESFERMARNTKYRKYKPDCPPKGNAKKWWHYAMNCVMKEEVKRRSDMWSWKHIQTHRKLCKEYTKAYLDKLDTSKPGSALLQKLEECEKKLDVFNITLCRQQAEAEFRRLGKKREKEGGGGWFSGWFGGGKKKEEKVESETDIGKRFADAMTEEEKAKMYAAIGYSEKVPDPTFPKEYVGIEAGVNLASTKIRLVEDTDNGAEILNLGIGSLSAQFQQRPAAEAINLVADLSDVSVHGTPLNEVVPQMVESQTQQDDQKLPQVHFHLETNPLDGLADQRIRLSTQPIKVVYDANTIIEIAKFFQPPKDVHLDDLSAAAVSSLQDISEQSTTGLQYMVDNKKITDIGVEIKPTYIIVPETGVFDGKGRVLVVDLGQVSMSTESQERHTGERLENETMEELVKKAYDKFNISLKSMQVILAGKDDGWQAARKQDNSPLHLLQPMGVDLSLEKCVVEDLRLPKLKLAGELPDITVDVSDAKLEDVLKLVLSIPFPESPKPTEQELKAKQLTQAGSRIASTKVPTVSSSTDKSTTPNSAQRKTSEVYVMAKEHFAEESRFREISVESDQEYFSADEGEGSSVDKAGKKAAEQHEGISPYSRSDVEIKFELKKIALNLSERKDDGDSPLASVGVHSLGLDLQVRPKDMNLQVQLGCVEVKHNQFKAVNGGELFLVKTPAYDAKEGRLLQVSLKKADKKHPEFTTTFKSTLQNIAVSFAGLQVVAHCEAILHLTAFADNLVASLDLKKDKEEEAESTSAEDEGYMSEEEKQTITPIRKRAKPVEVVDVSVTATLGVVSLSVCSNAGAITDVHVKGIEAGVIVQKDKTAVSALLQDITVLDPTPDAIHPRILSTLDQEVFKMKLTLYNRATEGSSYSDMDVVDIRVGLNIGCVRVVFLNKFVASVLAFVDKFSRAKAAAAAASAKAAQSAKSAVEDLQEKASRVALDVGIKAPLIVVPRSSTSDQALVANLGQLNVKNYFTIAEGTEAMQVPAVLDNMSVTLESIELSRAILESEKTKSDVLLLEPFRLQLNLTRNMAPWFHGVPAIAVSGKLETIQVSVNTDDFGIIMAVLNENLAEGKVAESSGEEEEGGATTTAATPDTATKTEEKAVVEVSSEGDKKGTSEVWVQINAAFELGGIAVSLYTGRVKLEDVTGRQERPAGKILGSFAVKDLGASATIKSDTSIAAKARLASVHLDDLRPNNENSITKPDEEGKQCNMIDVTFEQNATQDKTLKACLQYLHVCVCTEFLMTTANIFLKGLEEGSKNATAGKAGKSAKGPGKPAAATPAKTSEAAQGSMSIEASIIKPEILLVADSKSADTNALLLQFDADVKLNQANNSLSIQGGLAALRINACPYLESKRKGAINKVLVPCNIDFNLSNPDNKGMKIAATIPEIVLKVSPQTVMVLSAASQNLAIKADEDDKEATELAADLWEPKNLQDCDFWFLEEDDFGTDVEQLFDVQTEVQEPQIEELVATIDSIQVKIECESGKRFVPMINLQSSMQATVRNWSSKLQVSAHLKMDLSCYNERAASWEPLIEPLEHQPGQHRPWELGLLVQKNDDIVDVSSVAHSESTEDEDAIHLAPPVMTITVSSEDNLELTVTKTSLSLFQRLGEAFGDAVNNPSTTLQDNADIPACVVINQTGVPITFLPGDYYEKPSSASKDGRVSLKAGESSSLEVLSSLRQTQKAGSNLPSISTDMVLSFQVDGFEEITKVNIVQAGLLLYNLKSLKKGNNVDFSVVLEVEAELDARKVIIRSPLQFYNHFEQPLVLYTKASNWVEKVADIESKSSFTVPLQMAHTNQLLVGPAGDEYHTSEDAIIWTNLLEHMKEGKKSITFKCPAKQQGHTPFFFNIVPREQKMRYVKGSSATTPRYTLHLHPVVRLKNLLSVSVFYTLQGTEEEHEIKSTEETQMVNVDVGKTMMFMRIPNYNGVDWKGEMTLRKTLKEYSQWGLRGPDNKWMEIGVWVDYSEGNQDMAIFTPYWLINKTGLPLKYKAPNDEIFEHPADATDPILFAYQTSKAAIQPGKNKIQVKVCEAGWSDKFSLDAVGSTGFISCKSGKDNYEIGVKISLSNLNYTKMVVFTPRYLIVNEADFDISVQEPQGQWYDVPVHECMPFWPIDKKNNADLVVKKQGATEASVPFCYSEPHTTVLQLTQGGGIIVETQITEAATVVAFRNFTGGNFTLQLINHTADIPVSFKQEGIAKDQQLSANSAQLFTWSDPMAKRSLIWKVEEKEHKNNLIKDDIGEIKYKGQPLYWVSFLDGTQRMLLFTEDLAVATKARQAAELEQADQEVIVSLPGIGLSLVNNITRREVAYIGITSSGIIWQNKVRRRWKDFSIKDMKILEDGYQKHLVDTHNKKDMPPKIHKLDHGMEVDFTSMLMQKPKKHSVQRTYHHGLWVKLRKSSHQLQFHTRLNCIQVDNQMPAAIFQTVLAPVALPKTVAAESAPKPMIELCMMMRSSEHSKVKQFKYLKVLVQEMAVKLDMGFLSNISGLFAPDVEEAVDESKLMETDYELVKSPLKEAEYVQVALGKDFNFYDSFHLSPLKIHISFSLSDTGTGDSDISLLSQRGSARQNALNLIMQSVGVTLTNVDDVIFKLGFFEREYQFYSTQQLTSEVVKHYSNQAIKQLYVLVLGLDVIGNPFGFVRGVGEGVKDFFYEPYQGIVQGPEEFAEGVALGMRSLFGHAVGGAAGAVSRITGTLGKGLAALTMDDEYKRKRQQAINQKPATFQEGIARGGKGLVMGFYEGVSGVVKDPLKGAKKEGARGFLKGVGKGLAGVVAKPTGGIIDFASGTFEGIRRVVDVNEEIKKLRAPRFLGPDGVTRPYVRRDAEGLALLQMIEKGKYAAVEDYVAHMVATSDKKCFLVVTDNRVIYTHRGDVLGSWVVEFEISFADMKENPKLTDKGVHIAVKEKPGSQKRKGLGLGLLKGSKSSSAKIIHLVDKNEAEILVNKACLARNKYVEDHS